MIGPLDYRIPPDFYGYSTSPIEEEFWELTRRAYSSDEIQTILKGVEGRENECLEVLECLEKGVLSHPLFKNLDDLSDVALLGVKKGVITRATFATLMKVRLGLLEKNPQFIPLFINGKVNDIAKRYLIEMNWGGISVSMRQSYPRIKNYDHLNPSEMNEWLALMQTKPKSEQFLIVFQDSDPVNPRETALDKTCSVSKVLCIETGIALFNRVISEKLGVVTSHSLFETWIETRYKVAPKTNVVAGVSTRSQIINNRCHDKHDVAHPVKDNRLPPYADTFIAPPLGFHVHDMYHEMMACLCPKEFHVAGAWLSQIVASIEFSEPNEVLVAKFLARGLREMEAGYYRREFQAYQTVNTSNEKKLFWEMVAFIITSFGSANERVVIAPKIMQQIFIKLLKVDYDWEKELDIPLKSIEDNYLEFTRLKLLHDALLAARNSLTS